MLNVLINLATSRVPAALNALLLGGAVANEATQGIVEQITSVTSLNMLATIMGVAAIQFAVTWAKRRFGGKRDTGVSK